jgi:hypothetical protein
MSTTTTNSLSADAIRNKILNSKGQFVKASWKSNPKPKAEFKSTLLEKHTKGIVRSGINYSNLSSVQQGIADGTRGPVQELPFGEWQSFPYIIKHRPKDATEDVLYIRLYPTTHIPESIYYVDGIEVDKQTFATYLTPSESKKLLNPSENRPDCFTIKADNILNILEEG